MSKTSLKICAIFLCSLSLLSCGSENGGFGSSFSDATPAQEEDIREIIQAVAESTSFLDASSTSGQALQAQTAINCPQGGTVTVTDSSAVFDDCRFKQGRVINGTLSFSDDGTVRSITYEDFIVTKGNESLTLTGSVSFDSGDKTLMFDNLTASHAGGTYAIDGFLTFNGDDTVTGNLNFSIDDALVASCAFDNLNLEEATEEELNAACAF